MPFAIDYTVPTARPQQGGNFFDDFEQAADACSVLAPLDLTGSRVEAVRAGGAELPEDSSPAWDPAATYAVGDRVHVAAVHRVFESAAANNTGKDPTQPANQFNAAGAATWWIDLGPTNRSALFDSMISTPTAALSPLEIVLRPGAFNGMAMFGIEADYLTITVTEGDSGAAIYSYSAPLEGTEPADYYEYFFEPFKPQTQFIATGIEPYATARVSITLTKGSGLVRVGMLALGDLRPLGIPLRGASVEPVDYSYVSTDQFGNTTIRRRASATGLSIQSRMDIVDANNVLRSVQDLLGVPVVVVGSRASGYEALTVFGLLSGRLQYDNYRQPTLSMTVKGLI